MPRLKKPQAVYWHHNVALPETQEYLTKQGRPLPKELSSIVYVACYPWALAHIPTPPEVTEFCRFFGKHPDEAIQIMQFVRGRPRTQQRIVKYFLAAHNALLKKKDRFYLIGELELKVDKQTGVVEPNQVFKIADLPDGDIAAFLTQRSGLQITVASVTKAREELRTKKKK